MNLSKAMTLSVTSEKLESSEMSDLSARNTKEHVRPDFFLFFIDPMKYNLPSKNENPSSVHSHRLSETQISLKNSSDHRPYHRLRESHGLTDKEQGLPLLQSLTHLHSLRAICE